MSPEGTPCRSSSASSSRVPSVAVQLRDELVELALVRAARLVIAIARIPGELRRLHGLAQAREHRVLVGADHHDAIARRIDIRRRDSRQDRAAAFAHVTELVELGDQRLHHVEHRLVDGRVDHLAGAGAFAVMQRGQRAHAGMHGRQRIADADADARGRAVGLADDVAQAAHGLADAAVAGALRVRARSVRSPTREPGSAAG